MRFALALACTLALSGCLSSDGLTGNGSEEPAPAPHQQHGSFNNPLLLDGRTVDEGWFNWNFDIHVEPGHEAVAFAASWTCMSLCELEFWVEDPMGTEVHRSTGAGMWNHAHLEPMPGEWNLYFVAADYASTNAQGDVVLTAF